MRANSRPAGSRHREPGRATFGFDDRGQAGQGDALDGGFLAGRAVGVADGGCRSSSAGLVAIVAGDALSSQVELVVAQADDLVLPAFRDGGWGSAPGRPCGASRCVGDVVALLVEQEGGDIHRNLAVQGAGVVLHGLFFEDAQDVQRGRFGAADVAGAVAARAGDVAGLGEGRAQTLARQFEQAEAADLAGLHAGAVVAQGVAQAVLDLALVLLISMSMKSMTIRPPGRAGAAGGRLRRRLRSWS